MRTRSLNIALLVAAFALSVSAQFLSTGGEVVDVIDGRTIIVASPTGRVKVELQFVEVPEPQQKMYEEAKAHLRDLVFGKVVEYRPFRLYDDRTVGRVTLNKVDISQQMLRDGAAWYPVSGVSAQDADERRLYSEMEVAARSDKRGIWSVSGLKPPWEFRAERDAGSSQGRSSGLRPTARSAAKAKIPGAWNDENPAIGDVGMLTHGYNAAKRLGYVSTMLIQIESSEEEMANKVKSYLDFTYHYKEDPVKGRSGVFVVTLITYADNARFLRNGDLYLVEDKKTLMGKAKRVVTTEDGIMKEKLTFEVGRSAIEKLVLGMGHLKIGERRIEPRVFAYAVLYNMLQVSGKTQVASAEKPKK